MLPTNTKAVSQSITRKDMLAVTRFVRNVLLYFHLLHWTLDLRFMMVKQFAAFHWLMPAKRCLKIIKTHNLS